MLVARGDKFNALTPAQQETIVKIGLVVAAVGPLLVVVGKVISSVGTILTFARALGEFGATSMLAGNIPGKTATISQRIAMVIQDGDYVTAGFWVVIVLVIAFIMIFLINLITGKRMKNVRKW